MRTRAFGRGLLLAASVFISIPAAAQEFGLDLTSDAPDLRPSIAFLGVSATPENAEAAVAASAALENLARASNRFARVISPAELQTLLGDGYADALTCAEAECLTDLSHQLAVDRLLRAELTSTELNLIGFDWGTAKIEKATLDARVLKPAGSAEKKLAPLTAPVFQALGTVLGTLQVTSNVAASEIRWGGRLVGTGTEAKSVLPAGTRPLTVNAEGHTPVERPVTVTAAGTTAEQVTLEPLPMVAQVEETEFEVTKPAPAPSAPPAFLSKPGTWVAAAGVAVLAVGLGFGASANSVKGRMVDGNNDGVLDVTRAEALGAQRNATLANVFGLAGALMIGGGGAWVLLGDSESGAGSGGGVFVHGSF